MLCENNFSHFPSVKVEYITVLYLFDSRCSWLFYFKINEEVTLLGLVGTYQYFSIL